VRDTCRIPLSKEIKYFKKTRKIETNLEKNFFQKFVKQLENSIMLNLDSEEEDNVIYEDAENEISIYNEEEAVNYLDFNDDNNSMMSQNSHLDGNSSPSNNDLINNPFNNNISLMINNKNSMLSQSSSNFLEGFSHLRTEDLKSYLDSFGEGPREILNTRFNEFKNFSRKLENMDHWKFSDLDTNNHDNKSYKNFNKEKGGVKPPKKVQLLFDFSEEKEITEEDFDELFESKESKTKKLKEINNQSKNILRRENTKKRNTKKFYNFGMRV